MNRHTLRLAERQRVPAWKGVSRALSGPKIKTQEMVALLVVLAGHGLAQTNTGNLEDMPPLRPPRAELPPTFWQQNEAWIIAGLVLLVLLVGGGLWLILRPKPPAIVPPVVRAREELDSLRSQPETGLLLSKRSEERRGG